MRGCVSLVGAGPGDPDLLTIRAHRRIAEADVILYDRLVSDAVLALARRGAKLISVGKHEGEQEAVQREIEMLMLEHARKGRKVVRLKSGDPMVFGRGGEEWLFLAQHGIETDLVPGVTSAIAVPGLAGIPMTCRGLAQSFAVITGHGQDGSRTDWKPYAAIDTLVILMGVKHRSRIAQKLIEAGRRGSEPAAFVERGSTPSERVVVSTLDEIAAGNIHAENPAVFIVGEVVQVRAELMRIAQKLSRAA